MFHAHANHESGCCHKWLLALFFDGTSAQNIFSRRTSNFGAGHFFLFFQRKTEEGSAAVFPCPQVPPAAHIAYTKPWLEACITTSGLSGSATSILCGAVEACQAHNLEDQGSKPCGERLVGCAHGPRMARHSLWRSGSVLGPRIETRFLAEKLHVTPPTVFERQ